MDEQLLTEARVLADADLSVVPIQADRKYPAVAWKEFQKRQATQDELVQWFGEPGNLRIGVVTGAISGVFVLDVDYRHGGQQSIDEAKLAETALAIVASPGGRHYWFRYPAAKLIRSRNAWRQGVDLKADRAIALVPPSPGYSWERRWMHGS